MRVAREFISYMSREVARDLLATHQIECDDRAALVGWIEHAMTAEFSVEDRINEEARAILSQHEGEMQRLGASYAEAFKKIKAELARKHKAIL